MIIHIYVLQELLDLPWQYNPSELKESKCAANILKTNVLFAYPVVQGPMGIFGILQFIFVLFSFTPINNYKTQENKLETNLRFWDVHI